MPATSPALLPPTRYEPIQNDFGATLCVQVSPLSRHRVELRGNGGPTFVNRTTERRATRAPHPYAPIALRDLLHVGGQLPTPAVLLKEGVKVHQDGGPPEQHEHPQACHSIAAV